MLWQMTLHGTSLTCPSKDLERNELPNLRLTMEKVVSTLERLW